MSIAATIFGIAGIIGFIAILLVCYNGMVRLISSLFRLSGYAQTLQNSPHQRMLDADSSMPVSLILPDCDTDAGIEETVRSLLALDYPEYEVIAVCDSRRSDAMKRLVGAFGMVSIRQPIRRTLEMQPKRAVYRSPEYPGLIVLDKPWAGRHDALNAGVNISRYPLFAVLGEGVRLTASGLVDLAQPFAKSHKVVAVGGLPRVDTGDGTGGGPLAGLQQAEYLRSYPAGLAVPGQRKLPLVPGAFGAFRKQTVIERGGFAPGGSATEMMLRTHRQLVNRRTSHEVELLAKPVFKAEAPRGLGGLFRQHRRWQKDIMNTLWHNRGMTFNPRYGRGGLFDIPVCWLFEVILPVVELLACIAIPVGFALGFCGSTLFLAFLAAEVLFNIVVSLTAVVSQQMLESDSPSLSRLLNLLVCAILNNVLYRQILLLFRVIAMFTPNPGRGKKKRKATAE